MDQATLRDRMRWGMNIAARAMGAVTDVYRPQGPLKPLDHVNRILRMHAAFTPRGGSVVTTNVYGESRPILTLATIWFNRVGLCS
jgi:hypothetical protein